MWKIVPFVYLLLLLSCEQKPQAVDPATQTGERKIMESQSTAQRIDFIRNQPAETRDKLWIKYMKELNFDDLYSLSLTIQNRDMSGDAWRELDEYLMRLDPKKALSLNLEKGLSVYGLIDSWGYVCSREERLEVFQYLLSLNLKAKDTAFALESFMAPITSDKPSKVIQTINDFSSHPFYDSLVRESVWSLAWNLPADTLNLIRKMKNPDIKKDAMTIYGKDIMRRSSIPQWKDDVIGLSELTDPDLRAPALAGAFNWMLERDFSTAVTQIRTIKDQAVYDQVVVKNVELLDKRLPRDEVLSLIYDVQDPASVKFLEKFTGLDLSQTNPKLPNQ